MASTDEIGKKYVELCRQSKNLEALDTLFRKDAESVEAVGNETMPKVMKGVEAIRGKNEWWVNNHEIHGGGVKGPFPNGDRFAVIFDFDVTPTSGPMKGKRMKMEEVGLFTVEGGKIVREEFFYTMG